MEAYETDASLAQLPKEAAYPELVLRCTVMDAVPLRACEFNDDKVFTVVGSVAPSSPTDMTTATKALVRINFYNAWAAAAAFMDPGDVILLRGFAVIDVPPNVGGYNAANAGAALSSQSPMVRAPLVVRPLQVESTLRVLQKGEKNTVMEVSVSPENWDAVGVRSLPFSDAANQRYARMCWGWGKANA